MSLIYKIFKLKTKSWIKYWLYNKEAQPAPVYPLSEIITGASPLTLINSVRKNFNIFNISGNTKQQSYTGKNLVDISQANDSKVYGTGSTISFTENGFTVTTSSDFRGDYFSFPVVSGKTYTVFFKATGFTNYRIYADNTGTTEIARNLASETKYTFTASATQLLYLRFWTNANLTATLDYAQIEEGSNNTAYEPYVGRIASPNPSYPQEIYNISGEVEVKVANSFANHKYATENTKNWTSNGTIFQYDKINNNKMLAVVYTNIEAETSPTLTLRGLIGGSYSSNNKLLTAVKLNNKWAYYGYLTPLSTETKYWITNGAGNLSNITSKLFVYDASEFNISDEDLLKFMANPVDVYEEQTATFPLAEGQVLHLGDTLEDDGIHQRRFTKVFDGTETFSDFRVWGNYYRISTTINNAKIYGDILVHGQLCNYYSNVPVGVFNANENTKNGIFAQFRNQSFYFVIDKTSMADFKAFLAEQYSNGTPITLEYELEEEIIVPYTAEQQTAYNNLKNLYSYKGTTYISSSNEPSPVFEVQYYMEGDDV